MKHKHITPNALQQHESVFSLTVARQCTVTAIVLVLGGLLLFTQHVMASENRPIEHAGFHSVSHSTVEANNDKLILARLVTVSSNSGMRTTALEIPKSRSGADGYWLLTLTCLMLALACYAMSRLVRESPAINQHSLT